MKAYFECFAKYKPVHSGLYMNG